MLPFPLPSLIEQRFEVRCVLRRNTCLQGISRPRWSLNTGNPTGPSQRATRKVSSFKQPYHDFTCTIFTESWLHAWPHFGIACPPATGPITHVYNPGFPTISTNIHSCRYSVPDIHSAFVLSHSLHGTYSHPCSSPLTTKVRAVYAAGCSLFFSHYLSV